MRLFTAIPLPDEVISHLREVQRELARETSGSDVKWTAPENLHVTLKFLGEVSEEKAVMLIDELRRVQVPAARLFVDHITGFPRRSRAHTVVGELKGDCGVIGAMYGQIETACELIEVPRDRRAYTPHVTIGRSRAGVNVSPHSDDDGERFRGPPFVVSSFELIKSKLTSGGPIYERLAKYEGGKQ
jgi:2'-5' RNA ligase